MRALLRTEQQKGRVGAIRHRWEPVALVAALLPLLVWLAISGIGTLGATAGLFGMGLLTVVLELERTRAQLLGHGLRSRAEEAPVVQQAVAACSALAPLRRPVEVLIVQNPALQAFTFGLGRCAVIVLTSGLVQSLPPRELTAVIAHEWGHLALGHTVVMNLLGTAGTLTSLRRVAAPVLPGHRSQATIVPAGPDGARALLLSLCLMLAPLLLLWYRRLAEYGADRFAVLVVGEAAIAARALARVAAGAEVAEGVAFETLIEQAEELERSPLGWLQQALSSHPFVGSRLRAMREWEVSLNVGCRVREWGVECGEDARVAGENVETSP